MSFFFSKRVKDLENGYLWVLDKISNSTIEYINDPGRIVEVYRTHDVCDMTSVV